MKLQFISGWWGKNPPPICGLTDYVVLHMTVNLKNTGTIRWKRIPVVYRDTHPVSQSQGCDKRVQYGTVL